MADRPINNAPEQSDAMYAVYVRKNTSTNDLTQVPANQFAHAVGLTAANRGRFFRVNSSGDVESVAAGTNGQVLAWDSNGDLVATTVAAASLVKISSQTVSSPVASVVFTNIPASGYTSYLLYGINVKSSVAATTDGIMLHVSTDNGSTFKTTSGDYYTATTAQARLTNGNVSGANSSFAYGAFCMELIGLGVSTRATSGHLAWSYYGSSVTTASNAGLTNQATRVAAEADNAFRLTLNTGPNFTGGTFILYGRVE